MKDQLLEELKKLKGITPSEEYRQTSLRLILASRKPATVKTSSSFTLPFFRISGLVAVLGIVLLIAAQKNEVPLKLAGLDEGSLRAEAKELELTLKLAEVTYNPAKNNVATTALQEAAQNDTGHLNTAVIKKEAADLSPKQYINEDIDKALDEASK